MTLLFRRRTQAFAPFVGVAWGFGGVAIAVWPFVLVFQREGKTLAQINKEKPL